MYLFPDGHRAWIIVMIQSTKPYRWNELQKLDPGKIDLSSESIQVWTYCQPAPDVAWACLPASQNDGAGSFIWPLPKFGQKFTKKSSGSNVTLPKKGKNDLAHLFSGSSSQIAPWCPLCADLRWIHRSRMIINYYQNKKRHILNWSIPPNSSL